MSTSQVLLAAGLVILALVLVIGVLALRQSPTPAASPISPVTTPTSPTPSTSSPSPSASPSLDINELNTGVVRIDTVACGADGGGTGTGFLIAPDLVATVNDVVDGAVVVAVSTDTVLTLGSVVGHDAGTDVALVHLGQPLKGHVFTLAPNAPPIGTIVVAPNHASGSGLSTPEGTVTANHVSADRGMTDLIQTDAAVRPMMTGDSMYRGGGPLILPDRSVAGLVTFKIFGAQGMSYAVSAQTAAAPLAQWQALSSPLPAPRPACSNPVGPTAVDPIVPFPVGLPEGDGQAVALTLKGYFTAINRANYQTAWDLYTPAEQNRVPLEQLATGDRTSYLSDFDLISASMTAPGKASVKLKFRSLQDPVLAQDGQWCSLWQVDYQLVQTGNTYLINNVQSLDKDRKPTPCP